MLIPKTETLIEQVKNINAQIQELVDEEVRLAGRIRKVQLERDALNSRVKELQEQINKHLYG